MTHRVRFIERLRKSLHDNVDKIVDSLNQPNFLNTKSFINAFKIELDKLHNQSKKDD